MADLEQRFRSLGRTAAPDLWEDAQTRPPRPLPPAPRGGRVLAAVTALAVGIGGFLVAVSAFEDRPVPPADESPAPMVVANGQIAVAHGRDQDIVLLNPETGASTPLVERNAADLDQPAGLQIVWSPDGSKLAFTDYRQAGDVFGLFILDLATGAVRDLAQGVLQADDPVWSPDGTHIAFTGFGEVGYEIYVVRADGSGLRRVTDRPDNGVDGAYMPSWSPDGSRIAYTWNRYDAATETEDNGIAVVHLASGNETLLTTTPDVDESPAWSPDGSRLAFVRKVDGIASPYVVNSDGTDARPIAAEIVAGATSAPSWSPDGTRVVFGVQQLLETSDPGVVIVHVETDEAFIPLENVVVGSSIWSPDGARIAFVRGDPGRERQSVWSMGPDGSDQVELASGLDAVSDLAWQPRVVAAEAMAVANGPIFFQHLGDEGLELEPGPIESVELDGSDRRVVFADDPIRISQVAWSPDGSRIAYVNPVAGERGIYVANADGSSAVRLTDGPNDGHPSWSPDGTRIVFSSTAYDSAIAFCDGQQGQEFLCPTDVYAMDADGSNVVRLSNEPAAEFHPTWSPGGSRIAFVRVVHGETPDEIFDAPAIFTMATDGSDARQVSQTTGEWAGSDFSPTWSPDGTRIAFVGFRWEDFGLWVVEADGSDERRIEGSDFAFAPWWRNTPTWSPDGSVIAFVCLPEEDSEPRSLCLVRPDGTGLERIADVSWSTGDLAWQPRMADEPTPPTVQVRVETIEGIGPFPNAVVVGEGGVWVSSPANDGSAAGEVVRLDPVSGDVVARIPVEATPPWTFGGGGMAVGAGRIWVAGTVWASGTGHAAVEAIDPTTNTVDATLDLGDGDGADVWVDESGIWVLVRGSGRGHRIVKLDPTTHEIVATGEVSAIWSQTVFAAGGWIWVFGDDGRDDIAPDTMYRIDPATAQVVEQIELAHVVWVPATAPEATWFRLDGGVQRFDSATGEPAGDLIPPDVGCCYPPFVTDGSGGVWVATRSESHPTLRHVTPEGVLDVVAPIDPDEEAWDGVAYAFDPTTSTIWVVHYRDAVSRIEIVPDPA